MKNPFKDGLKVNSNTGENNSAGGKFVKQAKGITAGFLLAAALIGCDGKTPVNTMKQVAKEEVENPYEEYKKDEIQKAIKNIKIWIEQIEREQEEFEEVKGKFSNNLMNLQTMVNEGSEQLKQDTLNVYTNNLEELRKYLNVALATIDATNYEEGDKEKRDKDIQKAVDAYISAYVTGLGQTIDKGCEFNTEMDQAIINYGKMDATSKILLRLYKILEDYIEYSKILIESNYYANEKDVQKLQEYIDEANKLKTDIEEKFLPIYSDKTLEEIEEGDIKSSEEVYEILKEFLGGNDLSSYLNIISDISVNFAEEAMYELQPIADRYSIKIPEEQDEEYSNKIEEAYYGYIESYKFPWAENIQQEQGQQLELEQPLEGER